jgi:hypothetical protein
MKMFGELRLVRALTDKQIAAMRDPRLVRPGRLPTIEDPVKAGGFLARRPEDIIEALKAVENRYPGLDRVICASPSAFREPAGTAHENRISQSRESLAPFVALIEPAAGGIEFLKMGAHPFSER